ncbi:MAG TPA: M12 family metallopeptidase [Phycisphaerales bacterium]|nr:M12 family metallopeptidase [Phycisphaerales bacterium]
MPVATFACLVLAGINSSVLAQTQIESDLEWRSRPPRECAITEPPFADRSLWNANTWPGGIVPYSFAANATRDYRIEMRRAMDEIEYVCNVTFLPRSTETNYIVIQDSTANNSQVGMVGGAQTINIFNWNSRYIMVHELMHALGVWHEQSRADRGAYVQINAQNIQPGAANNFDVVPTAAPEGPFDFESVMLYEGCSFSNCCPAGSSCACAIGCATIEALPPYTALQSAMGQRNRLSEGDKAGLVSRYGVSTAWTRAITAAVYSANGKVYVLGGRSTWTLAQRRAVDLGGSLATVRSMTENQFIYSTFSAFGGVNRNLWIGYHDTDQSSNSTDRATRRGEFGWVSGETSTYSRWSGVEPNNPSVNEPSGNWEFYVHIWQPVDPNASTWNNLSDSNTVFNAPVCGVVETCVFAPATPVSASVCPSASAQFTVNAVGAGTLSYQWQHNGADIAAGDPAYTGANGPSLIVVQATAAELGAYRCWVSNACGGVWSSTCVLKHEEPSACTACDPIDFNGDGLFPDTQDIADFLTVFGGGACPTGACGDIDFNNDGLFPDTADIAGLLSVFSGGPCV